MAAVLCIGIGNPYRSDDSVGLRVVDRLRGLPDVQVIEHSGEGVSLMDAWQGADGVILIDAVSSGAEPGTWFQFAAHESPLPGHYFAYSTHAFGVTEAIELARSFGELPPYCIVFGIEGARFDFGVELSPKVEQTAEAIVPVIARVIHGLQEDCRA